MNELELEKEKFLRWQFFMLTISASFRRGNVYKKDVIEDKKKAFRKSLYFELNYMADNHESFKTQEALISSISFIMQQSKSYDQILQGQGLRFGTCQKLVNLYLKYLWCAGIITEPPPHFPLDRLIQRGSKKINWTFLEDSESYVARINELCPKDNKAEWELLEYNKQFYN